MHAWNTGKLRTTLFAAVWLAMGVFVWPLPVQSADADNTTDTLGPTASNNKRMPKSKSSASLGADGKRSKVTLPSREATTPTTISSQGLRGKASFYSPRFQGRKTASGDIFNNKLFTAASNLFPLGSLVAVKRPDTNLCVVVKVNDRMHAKHQARVIDLSHSAAKYLDMVRDGVVKVQVARIPEGAAPGSTFECAMGYELEEACDDCPANDVPLQSLNH